MSRREKRLERLDALMVEERRSRTAARLSGDPKLREQAQQLSEQVEMQQQAIGQRQNIHLHGRKSQKNKNLSEYNALLIRLKRLPDAARTSNTPLSVQDEAEKIVMQLFEAADRLGIKSTERPSGDDWLAEMRVVIRFRTMNDPEMIVQRMKKIRDHETARKGCHCDVCRYVRSGQMGLDGRFIDKMPKDRRLA